MYINFFFRNRQPLDFFQALKRTVQIGLLAVPNRSGKVSPLFEKYLIIYISSLPFPCPPLSRARHCLNQSKWKKKRGRRHRYPSPASKIDSDRKRKKSASSISSADRTVKEKRSSSKKNKMSSSAAAGQVRASHILIKHQGSRRPASWKDPEGRIIKNTTRDSAVSQLTVIRDDILSGKSKFEDVATRISDCSSAKRGGDLGLLTDLISLLAIFFILIFLIVSWNTCFFLFAIFCLIGVILSPELDSITLSCNWALSPRLNRVKSYCLDFGFASWRF